MTYRQESDATLDALTAITLLAVSVVMFAKAYTATAPAAVALCLLFAIAPAGAGLVCLRAYVVALKSR